MSTRTGLVEEVLIYFEPHHDSEVDVYVRYAGAHYRYLDAIFNVQFQVCHLHLMSDAIKLRPALIICLDAEEILDYLLFRGAFALDDAVFLIELREQFLDIRWSIIGLCQARKHKYSC